MAATAWSFYNSFKEKLGNAVFDLDATTPNFRMALFTNSASTNANNEMKLPMVMVMQLAEYLFQAEHGLLRQLISIDGMLQP